MNEFKSLRNQRGAAALFAAVGLIGILAAAGFAIDLAQLRNAQRSLQDQANLSALNAARAAGGCLAPDADRQLAANAAVLNTITGLGGDASWFSGGNANLGEISIDADGLRQFLPLPLAQAGEAYAFEVNLQRPFPDLLLPMPGVDTDGAVLTARATASQAPAASYRVGSYLLNVGPGEVAILNSLLEALLGTSPELEVLGVEGLVATSVELRDLAAELGAASVEELLASPVVFPDFLLALANVVLDSGESAVAGGIGAADGALQDIAAASPNDTVVLGDAFSSGSALVGGVGDTSVNVLDLVRATAMQVGDPVIELLPQITVPGVADITAQITLGQPTTLGAGPAVQDELGTYLTSAFNSQGNVDLQLDLLPLLGDVISLNLEVDLVEAQADLLEIRCAGRGRSQPEVDLGVTTSVASIQLNNDGVTGPPLVNLLGLIQICASSTPVSSGVAGYERVEFAGPFDAIDPVILQGNTELAGSGLGGQVSELFTDVVDGTTVEFCPGSPTGVALNLLLSPILATLGLGSSDGLLDLVDGLLSSALTGAVDPLVEPLLSTLGVDLIGAKVTVLDVHNPGPTLIEAE